MTAAPGKTVKLLLAEDNPLVRALVSKALDPFCEVMIAADGADALLRVVDELPDVILCDYKMAGLDGRQLFEKLRGRRPPATFHFSSWPAARTSKNVCDRLWMEWKIS